MPPNDEQDAAGATIWGKQVEGRDGLQVPCLRQGGLTFPFCTRSVMGNDPSQSLLPSNSTTREGLNLDLEISVSVIGNKL